VTYGVDGALEEVTLNCVSRCYVLSVLYFSNREVRSDINRFKVQSINMNIAEGLRPISYV